MSFNIWKRFAYVLASIMFKTQTYLLIFLLMVLLGSFLSQLLYDYCIVFDVVGDST